MKNDKENVFQRGENYSHLFFAVSFSSWRTDIAPGPKQYLRQNDSMCTFREFLLPSKQNVPVSDLSPIDAGRFKYCRQKEYSDNRTYYARLPEYELFYLLTPALIGNCTNMGFLSPSIEGERHI